MNQPTRQEFDDLKEEVRKLRERQTEPITIPRIELDPGGIQMRLDNQAEIMKEHSEQLQLLYNQSATMQTDIAVLKTDMGKLRERVESVEQKVDGGFQSVEKRLEAIAGMQKMILERLPEK